MSLMSAETFRSLWPGRRVETTKVRLCAYSKEPIPKLGWCYVNIEYKGQTAVEVPLIVVYGSGLTLLRRNWLSHIQLNWQEIHHVNNDSLQSVLDMYSAVFQGGLGKLQGFKAKIHVEPGTKLRFCRARSVPYPMLGHPCNKNCSTRDNVTSRNVPDEIASQDVRLVACN